MTNKDLITQLHNCKEIKPDTAWMQENRDVLYAQITNSSKEFSGGFWVEFSDACQVFFSMLAQPAVSVALFVLILVGGVAGITASGYFGDMKPGDSLYIARTISQRAQIAVTFDRHEKKKLEVKFAKERARDIASVLAQSDLDEVKRQKLNDDFRKEISIVKEKISDIDIAMSASITESQNTPEEKKDEGVVFSASSEKDDQGVEIVGLRPSSKTDAPMIISPNNDDSNEPVASLSSTTASIIEDAEKFFDNQDYENVLNKLDEVDKMIDAVDNSDASNVVQSKQTTKQSETSSAEIKTE